jgi:hypothetical protein
MDGTWHWSALMQVLPYYSMVIGIGEITEDNLDEFYTRMRMNDMVSGTLLTGLNKETGKRIDHPISYHQLRQHIGFRCNVAYMSMVKFRKQLFEKMEREVDIEKNAELRPHKEYGECEHCALIFNMDDMVERDLYLKGKVIQCKGCVDLLTRITEDYWDCECLTDYIHKKGDGDVCANCGCCYSDGRPDSHAYEVALMLEAKGVSNDE